jgi:hypothetical protein
LEALGSTQELKQTTLAKAELADVQGCYQKMWIGFSEDEASVGEEIFTKREEKKKMA